MRERKAMIKEAQREDRRKKKMTHSQAP